MYIYEPALEAAAPTVFMFSYGPVLIVNAYNNGITLASA
jgi:hypothetical protein